MKCIVKECGEPQHRELPRCAYHEIEEQKRRADFWHNAWWDSRETLGSAMAYKYYQGVIDVFQGRVFDLNTGVRYYGVEVPVGVQLTPYYDSDHDYEKTDPKKHQRLKKQSRCTSNR